MPSLGRHRKTWRVDDPDVYRSLQPYREVPRDSRGQVVQSTRVGAGSTISIVQKVGDPGHEREFDLIDVEFFVIKEGLH